MKLYIYVILALLAVTVISRATLLAANIEYRPSRVTMLIDLLLGFVLIVWGVATLS